MSASPDAALLDDLVIRFVLNVPAEELESPERLMFVIEQAHWFYEDFCRLKDPALRSLSLKAFASLLLAHCPSLGTRAGGDVDALAARFAEFKQTVPTMGCILLDPTLTKVLLVRGIKDNSAWGFPRGKLSKGESDSACAARETLEETGLDIGPRIDEGAFIEVHLGQQRSRLYIVAGIDESTPFAPTCRGEIGDFAWHLLADLPSTREASSLVYATGDGVRHRFWRVWPYVKQLNKWVKANRKRLAAGGVAGGGAPVPPPEPAAAAAMPPPAPAAAAPPQPAAPKAGKGRAARAAAPAAAAQHLHAPPEPGQAWITWPGFDHAAVLACLSAP